MKKSLVVLLLPTLLFAHGVGDRLSDVTLMLATIGKDFLGTGPSGAQQQMKHGS